jgi:hypothetical protein
MIRCKNCLEFVEKLKPNSHVIPKWVMVRTKDKGRNLSIKYGKISKNQNDLVTESWCHTCEEGFRDLDTYGATFFRNLEKYKGDISDQKLKPFRYVFGSAGSYYVISKFILSLAVRHYLHSLTFGEPLREAAIFKVIFEKYHDDSKVQFTIFDVSKFALESVKLPSVVKGNIQMMINGYLIVIAPSVSKDAIAWLSDEKEMIIFRVTDPKIPYVKSFIEAMSKKKMPTRNT